MKGSPTRARRRAARAVRQPTRMTEYQRHRQTERPTGTEALRAYLYDDLDLDVSNELVHPEQGLDQDEPAAVDESADTEAEVVHPDPEPVREPTAYELAILGALQNKPVYMGDMAADDIRKRRLRNRDSKRGRRLQRRAKVRQKRRRQHRANAAAVLMLFGAQLFIGAVWAAASPGVWWS